MSSNSAHVQGRNTVLNILLAILVFGSLWGLSEVVLGGVLKSSGFPYRAGLLTGVAMGIMGVALAMSRKWLMPIGIGVVAGLVTLLVVPVLHVSPMCKANSCLALILEAGSLSAAAVLVGGKATKSAHGRMAMGGGAALTASAAFYFAGIHFAPCPYLLSFTAGSFVMTEGIVWAAFSAIMFPLGYAIGEKLAVRQFPVLSPESVLYYSGGAAVVAVCWGISGAAIAAGL